MTIRAIDLFAGAGGTSTDAIKQIGNAVPVGTARALCDSILRDALRAA